MRERERERENVTVDSQGVRPGVRGVLRGDEEEVRMGMGLGSEVDGEGAEEHACSHIILVVLWRAHVEDGGICVTRHGFSTTPHHHR